VSQGDSGNLAGGDDGGVYGKSDAIRVWSGSQISGNSDASGGGIYAADSLVVAVRSLVGADQRSTGNVASSSGGGIYTMATSQVINLISIDQSIISGNSAINGDGIYNAGNLISLTERTIGGETNQTGNTADIGPASELFIEHSTISRN
jgi:hypothetical protein